MPRKSRKGPDPHDPPPVVGGRPGRGGRGASADSPDERIKHAEVRSWILRYLCEGKTPAEVKEILWDRHRIRISRERPYQIFSWGARRGEVRYTPPLDRNLTDAVEDAFPALEAVEVVSTASFDAVAERGARMLARMACQRPPDPDGRRVVHIGFAGGLSMRNLAWAFAEALTEARRELPDAIVLHALVSGFDVWDTTTDPNAFFSHFKANPVLESRIQTVGLHSLPLVTDREFREIRGREGVREAFDRAPLLDIVVTSASLWQCQDSQLFQFMQKSPRSFEALSAEGVVGDMLWRPLGRKGPIEIETELRAMTVLELSGLSALIREGKKVLLALGPCGGCHQHKGGILKAILDQPQRLVTHLAADIRSTYEMLSMVRQEAA